MLSCLLLQCRLAASLIAPNHRGGERVGQLKIFKSVGGTRGRTLIACQPRLDTVFEVAKKRSACKLLKTTNQWRRLPPSLGALPAFPGHSPAASHQPSTPRVFRCKSTACVQQHDLTFRVKSGAGSLTALGIPWQPSCPSPRIGESGARATRFSRAGLGNGRRNAAGERVKKRCTEGWKMVTYTFRGLHRVWI